VVINVSLCEMNRMAIVPTNEFSELDALAVFRDPAKAIFLHALNLHEPRKTRNLQVGNFGLFLPGGAANVCLSRPEVSGEGS
jgi:hypothetical protein